MLHGDWTPEKKGGQLETTVIIQVRKFNGLNQGSSNGGGEKWSEL